MNVRSILSLVFVLVLSGCSKFKEADLIESRFGVHLLELAEGKAYRYTDGCLEVFHVVEEDALYQAFLGERFESILSTEVRVDGLERSFRATGGSPIRYRVLSEIDGYRQVVFYSYGDGTMVFVYAKNVL